MTTPKQVAANRENARKSTGPRSKVGKAAVARNAIKHGLLSAEAFLPWEDPTQFILLKNKMFMAFRPDNEIESLLVDRCVSLLWRLKRVGRIEAGLFEAGRYALNFGIVCSDPANRTASEVQLQSEIDGAIQCNPDQHELARIFAEDVITFANLHRYESGLERSLYKAVHELHRLQASRQGQHVVPPIAIDISADDGRLSP